MADLTVAQRRVLREIAQALGGLVAEGSIRDAVAQRLEAVQRPHRPRAPGPRAGMATAPGGMPCDCGHDLDLAALAAVDAEG